jgi:CRISPR-associated protein Cas2
MSDARAWLVAYDIADPRRLGRVHRRMLRHAAAIGYSVFWLAGTPTDRLRCLLDVLPLLEPAEDDLRMYALAARGLRLRLGRAVLPEGIAWSALPAAFLWDGGGLPAGAGEASWPAESEAVGSHGGAW